MKVKFNLGEQTVFKVNDGIASIIINGDYTIWGKTKDGERQKFNSLLDADEFITRQTRTIDDILENWINMDTELPLYAYATIIDEQEESGEVQVGTGDKLAAAIATVLQELNKPKDNSNKALSDIENRLKQLVYLEERKIIMMERKDTIKGTEKHTWKKTIQPSMDFNSEVSGHNLEDLKKALFAKKALLLRGVPGTGKTRIMNALAYNLVNGDTSRLKLINLNQNTEYADFIGGLTLVDGNWQYSDGTLTKICKDADADRNNIYILCMDEISRSNFAAVIGELMTGIEHRDKEMDLPNGSTLLIPSNLYFIATMNTLDISTTKIDKATEERFNVEDILPQWNRAYIDWLTKDKMIDTSLREKLYKIASIMKRVNTTINENSSLKDQVIGTRAISGFEITNENIDRAIKNRLIVDIRDRNSLIRNETMLMEEIGKLEALCNEKS